MMSTSCTVSPSNPEAALLGTWNYVSHEDGSSAYCYDLEFLEDRTLIIDSYSEDQFKFVIIAPGRLKISSEEDSQVINYEIEENTLKLFFNNGTNIYQRIPSPSAISQLTAETQSATATEMTAMDQAPTVTLTTTSTLLPPATPTNQATLTETITTPTPEQAPAIGSSFTRQADGVLMMYVPEGSFLMGSSSTDGNVYAHEKPQHEVELDAYWMDAYEVSNAMFRSFVEATGYRTQAEQQGYSYMYNASGDWDTFTGVDWQHPLGAETIYQDLLPVTHVNQYDAKAYCEWVGGRLPTEAEWEKAARGEDARIYPWGNTFNASYLQSDSRSGPVSIYEHPEGASLYGIMNMAGNVFEWTSDWYDADYYAYSPRDNPTGPASGEYAAIRGGAWTNSSKHVRTAHRDISMPHLMNHLLGFRCVMEP